MKFLISWADRVLRPVEIAAGHVAGVIIMGLMALVLAEVVGRSVFNSPIHGNLDIVEQLMVPVASLGIAFCQARFGNIRMTLVTQNFAGRRRWLAEVLSLAVGLAVVFVYLLGSYRNLQRALTLGGGTPEIGLPLWLSIGCVTFALGLLFARLVIQFLEAVRMLLAPNDTSPIIWGAVKTERES